MFKKCTTRIKSFFKIFKLAQHQFRTQSAYEIGNVPICQKTGQHVIEVKITGKGQSIPCLAEEIVVDNNFIMGFAPSDIRTITYLATCDRYEKILLEEKIKKSYELIRSKSRGGNKTVQLRHKETNEHMVVSLNDFSDQDLIDKLVSQDAYYLGYLAGQEQTLKDCVRLKLIARSEETDE
jgi:rRNA-processing protein FCF1